MRKLKTHCRQGHEYTPENTYLDAKGYRSCATCSRKWARDAYARRSEKIGRKEHIRWPMPTDQTVLAYAAGIFDGEGSIGITKGNLEQGKRKRYHRLVIRVTNTDPRLPAWLETFFAGKVRRHDFNRPSRSPAHTWILSSVQAADFLRAIRPYMLVKAEQADLALVFQATMGRGREVPITPDLFAKRERLKIGIQHFNKLRRLKAESSTDTPALDDNFEEEQA